MKKTSAQMFLASIRMFIPISPDLSTLLIVKSFTAKDKLWRRFRYGIIDNFHSHGIQ